MKRIIVSLAAGALLLTAGCSGEADGQAESTGGEPTQTSSAGASSSAPESSMTADLPHSGAPKVADPLPESVLSDDSCEALTPDQLTDALGKASPGEPEDLPVGPSCRWSNPERFSGITVTYSVESRQGLSAQYANTKPDEPTFQEASPVLGLPAVEFKPSEGSPTCTTAVGLADEYSVSVTVTLGRDAEGADPCQGAARVAEDVVGNLKAKA